MKRLYRSKNDRVVAGICGGIAEYFNADPTIVRLLFVFGVLVTGIIPLVIVYIIGAFIIPENPNKGSSL
ncbi:MAG TPA: hypothetical protein DCY48_02690 [Candidatus Magasanikbacteria bacterium]|nr:MAG: hypothetical protein A3I74_01790 [Candidatus Magasanikbacteria bacterium RIFCSPLOWO2_02_FULL_47_16]OGH79803.1 MAG: hypothetical protein A3C10_01425 [Candidatus Magasanikbacteria bacterium RIFCSPHIGHO2_02_FULL_48_18]HAZ28660.1 hypothetical protein [Candidatus Magasanikbacteria bacterium]